MASLPQPRSFNAIVGGMIDAFLASYGLKGLKVGSPILSIFEAAAESDLRNSQDIFALLRATTLEQAAGTALDRLAADEQLVRQTETFANSAVDVVDSSFTKVVSSIFQGTPAPIAGVSTINLVSDPGFTATGSVYLGRGTNNYEGPLAYTAIAQVGVYWQVTLSTPTQNFHNIGESVILAQGGNRQVPAGSIAQTPQGNASLSVQFRTLYTATLPDGETTVNGVTVVALLPGISGNVQEGAISQWAAVPFTGATVTNPLPVTTALPAETDDQLRERIREHRATRAQGTVLALVTGLIGATSPDENLTISSAAYVGAIGASAATLYIDDGSGYEEIFTGVAQEVVVAQALGGEQDFQIANNPPVTKANLTSAIAAPYTIPSGAILALWVGGVLYEHTFSASDFQNPLAGTAYEVVASINADATLGFQARPSAGATTVTLFAKADTNESLQVASSQLASGDIDANASLAFPVGLVQTMSLYRNDRLLSKDGTVASLASRPVSQWGLFSPVETLIVQVDGTAGPAQTTISVGTGTGSATNFSATALIIPIQPGTVVILVNGVPVGTDNGSGNLVGSAMASGSSVNYTTGVMQVNFNSAYTPVAAAAITAFYVSTSNGSVPVYTITAQSFINAQTGYTSVGLNSLAAWAAVLNATVPGLTATPTGNTLTLTSNLGTSARAALAITGGTLLGKIFNLGSSQGSTNQYTLDRNTGQFGLLTPLNVGDTLTLGSNWTRAFIQSPAIVATNIVNEAGAAAPGANFWFLTDGRAQIIPTGLTAGTQLTYSVTQLETWGARVRMTSTAASALFANVEVGDNLIMWDPALPSTAGLSDQGRWRIDAVDPLGTWVEVGRQSLPFSGAGMSATLLADGINVLVCGGSRPSIGDVVASACLYNTSTGVVTNLGAMTVPRAWHTATLITSGSLSGYVLLAGGFTNGGSFPFTPGNTTSTVTAELYNPTTKTFAATGSLPVAVANAHAVFIASGTLNGDVLVAGGWNAGLTGPTAATYYFVPGTATWTTGPTMLQARLYHQLTYTGTPTVLVSGGTATPNTTSFLTECETLNLTTLVWSTTGALSVGRWGHRVTLLADGTTVAATGGYSSYSASFNYTATKVVEVFNGSTWSSSTIPNTAQPHVFHAALALGTSTNPTLVLVGGVEVPTNISFPTQYTEAIAFAGSWPGSWNESVANSPYPNPFWSCFASANGSATSLGFVGGGTPMSQFEIGFTLPNGSAAAQVLTEVITAGPVFTYTWTPVVDATLGVQTLTNAGAVVARSLSPVQQVQVPAQTNVLAPTLATAMSAVLEGAAALVYQTNEIRVDTNTFDLSGDIALVTTDIQAQQFGLPTGSAIVNLPQAQPAVTSGNSDLGTPNFLGLSLTAVLSSTLIQVMTASEQQNGNQKVSSGSQLVGLQGLYDNNNVAPTYVGGGTSATRFGSNFAFSSTMATQVVATGNPWSLVTLRQAPGVEWLPQDRIYAAASMAFTPMDSLTVVLNEDPENLSFTVPFARHLAVPSGTNTYAQTNAFVDADNGGQSLAVAFGTPPNGFSFNDFAVWMHARCVTDPSTVQAMLWRYYRYGPEGNVAEIRYDYPAAPSLPVAVAVDFYGAGIAGQFAALNTNISVVLPSGAAITSGVVLRATTRVGLAAIANTPLAANANLGLAAGGYTYVAAFALQTSAAARAAGTTTLTLVLPAGITDHGLQIGNAIYLASTNGNLAAGVYVLTGRSTTTISYADTGSPASYSTASSVGNVSFDIGATSLGSSLTTGNIFTANATSSVPAAFQQTLGIHAYDGQGVLEGYVNTFSGTPGTVLSWSPIGNAAGILLYPVNTAQNSVAQIATAVNALEAATGSVVPVTAFALPGSSGSITQSSTDSKLINCFYQQFSDGKNYVQSTGYSGGNYTLTFKDPINSVLATNSDWQDESVVVVPTNVATAASWMNQPAVTGLFQNAEVQAAANGHKLVIASDTLGSAGAVQVQGGSANSISLAVQNYATAINESTTPGTGQFLVTSVIEASASGLSAGAWCALQNVNPMPRTYPITSATVLQSIDSLGNVTVTGQSVINLRANYTSFAWQVEFQGNFVAYTWAGIGDAAPTFQNSILEGDYVFISTYNLHPSGTLQTLLSGSNTGLFRVVRSEWLTQTFWIENPSAVPQTGWAHVRVVANDSLLPGDVITISTPTNVWGANRGRWTVASVGVPAGSSNPDLFQNSFIFQLKSSAAQPVTAFTPTSPVALGSANAPLIQVQEGVPSRLIKKVGGIAPNQGNSTLLDLKFDTAYGYAKVSSAAGTLVQPVGKLGFSTGVVNGIDAYAHSVGLIGEANQIVYGNSQDTATYPGIAAAGANINISGPNIRRILIGLSLRTNASTANRDDVEARVQSAVASYVNSLGVGQPVVLSQVVAAAQAVYGVSSAVITSPTYSLGSDEIAIQPYEKPMVLNLSDITVSTIGD